MRYLSILTISSCFLLSACGETTGPSQAKHNTEPTPQHKVTELSQTALKQFAQQLEVNYQVITNRPDQSCDQGQTDGLCYQAKITLVSPDNFPYQNWQLYFSQTSPIQSVLSDQFTITHINGDLHVITPTPEFTGFEKNVPIDIVFRAGFWQLSESDQMPNYYITAENLAAEVIASTQTLFDTDTGLEIRPFVQSYTDPDLLKRTAKDSTVRATPEVLFTANQVDAATPATVDPLILPTPFQQTLKSGTPLDLQRGLHFQFNQIRRQDLQPAINYLDALGIKENSDGIPVNLSVSALTTGPESYQLDITSESITITGHDQAGALYGLYSIASAVNMDTQSLTLMSVQDKPRYPFRGLHIDVARNFHSKALILKLIEQMAAVKLNKLHLHLADDEGWRIEIDGLPELTEIGGYRCHDLAETQCLLPQLGSGPSRNSNVNGYFSQQDYIEIIQAAQARQIQVIPSLDMPGHSRAAVVAMKARYSKYIAQDETEKAQQYLLSESQDTTQYSSVQFYHDNTINVCIDSSYNFVAKVLTEIAKLHQTAGQPLTRYHIGADETAGAWVESPACQSLIASNDQLDSAEQLSAYFIQRITHILAQRNIQAAAWSDGLSHVNPELLPEKIQSNAWELLSWQGHKTAQKHANQGWDVVISSPDVTYFDFPYEADPKEHGYYWASRHTNTAQVFSFMPDNLPVHAEFWLDREDNPYESIDDTPLQEGMSYYGLQAQLWSETVRTDAQVEYMLFPRLLALAERAWHQADWEVPYQYQGGTYNQQTAHFTPELRKARDQDWQDFRYQLGQKQLAKLDAFDLQYRIPTAGAVVNNGILSMNCIFPLPLEYRLDDGPWQTYSSPVAVDASQISVRALSPTMQRKGRIQTMDLTNTAKKVD